MASQNKIPKTMNKIGLFLKRQFSQIQEGGVDILSHKIRKLFKLLWFSLFAPMTVYLRADWPEAYYFVWRQLFKQHRKICSQPGFVKKLAKIQKIEKEILYCVEKYLTYKLDLDSLPILISASAALVNLSYTKERFERALEVLRHAENIRFEMLKKHQLDKLDSEFIPRGLAVGSLGVWENLEVYLKAGVLGLRTPKKLVLLLDPKSRINNPCYFKYWQKYITVISDPLSIKNLSQLEKNLATPFTFYMSIAGKPILSPGVLGLVRKQWDTQRRPPLLTLTADDHERGWRCLESFGAPQDAWFVCLHVREGGWNDNHYAADFRNADIATYLPAIKAVVEAGGWVIRMGDPGMKPLPKMDHVIDYAHSPMKSDWMDVFLCAKCRFMIGTSSGLYTLSSIFGMPTVMTNSIPPELMYQLSSKDLFIPAIFYSKKKNLSLSFRDVMSPPLLTACEQHLYDQLGLEVIKNTAEEIKGVVAEMLARVNGVLEYSEEDEHLQNQFKLAANQGELYGDKNVAVHARIGRDFLRKYVSLLPPNTLKDTSNEVQNASL